MQTKKQYVMRYARTVNHLFELYSELIWIRVRIRLWIRTGGQKKIFPSFCDKDVFKKFLKKKKKCKKGFGHDKEILAACSGEK